MEIKVHHLNRLLLCAAPQAYCSDHISCLIPSYSLRVIRWEHRRNGHVGGCADRCHATQGFRTMAQEPEGSAPDSVNGSGLTLARSCNRAPCDEDTHNGSQKQFIVSDASAALDYQFLAPPLMFLTECILSRHSFLINQPAKFLPMPPAGRELPQEDEGFASRGTSGSSVSCSDGGFEDEPVTLFLVPLALRLTQACLDDPSELQRMLECRHQGLSLPRRAIWSLAAEACDWHPAGDARGAYDALHPLSPPYHSLNARVSPTRFQVRLWHIERLYNAVNLMQVSTSVPHRVLLEKLKGSHRHGREPASPDSRGLSSTEPLQLHRRGTSSLLDNWPRDNVETEQNMERAAGDTPGGRGGASLDETASHPHSLPFRNLMPLADLRKILGVVEQERSSNWRQVCLLRELHTSLQIYRPSESTGLAF